MQRRKDTLGRLPLRGVVFGVVALAWAGMAQGPAAAQPSPAPLAYDVLPVGPGGAPVFVGTAEPGATVDLLDGAIVVATGVANDRGEWILAAPGPAGNAGTFTVRVTSPGGRFQTLPTPPPIEDPTPVAARVTANLAEGRVEGTAAPDVAMAIAGAGPVPLAAVADREGHWTVALPQLPAGAYALRVTTGDTSADAAILIDLVLPLDPGALRVTVAVAEPALALAGGTLAGPRFIIVGPRDTLWDIAMRAYGDGTRYRDIFTANRDQLRDPRRIFAGQVLLIP